MSPLLALAAALLLLILVALFWRRRTSRRSAPIPSAGDPRLVAELRRDVEALCAFGPRNHLDPAALARAADWIEEHFRAAGYEVERQRYALEIGDTHAENLIVEIRGRNTPDEIVVIGAHYDSVYDSPGADDNASGVAGLLAIARRLRGTRPARTLRFVAFADEEPPQFQTRDMGSWRYANRCAERDERIVAMVSLEAIGYFAATAGSQQYPPPISALYPDTADFLGFVGNLMSRRLVDRSIRAFRASTSLPAEAAVFPELIPEIGWSDQWAFWQFGWPAIMVTDTALYRNPNYHTELDTPDTLDYQRMAQGVAGLVGVARELAEAGRS